MKKYYAVKTGRNPGIYESWDECKEQTDGFSGAVYKSFSSYDEALNFIDGLQAAPKSQSGLTAYVDGSYSDEKKMFSFGAVLIVGDKQLHFSKVFSDPELVTMRNVAGEIKAAEFVMYYCLKNGIKSVDIYYDYEGIEKWCTGVWKANKDGTQKYVKAYKTASKSIKINFIKVKSHSGNTFNDLADSLAKQALGIK